MPKLISSFTYTYLFIFIPQPKGCATCFPHLWSAYLGHYSSWRICFCGWVINYSHVCDLFRDQLRRSVRLFVRVLLRMHKVARLFVSIWVCAAVLVVLGSADSASFLVISPSGCHFGGMQVPAGPAIACRRRRRARPAMVVIAPRFVRSTPRATAADATRLNVFIKSLSRFSCYELMYGLAFSFRKGEVARPTCGETFLDVCLFVFPP